MEPKLPLAREITLWLCRRWHRVSCKISRMLGQNALEVLSTRRRVLLEIVGVFIGAHVEIPVTRVVCYVRT